jgi:hypothetical protein
MSEENTNNIVPAMLSEGEAVIPAHKVEEFKAAVEEILQASQEIVEETVVEETVVEDTAVEEKVETKVEEVAAELNLEPKISVVEEAEEKNVISSSSQKRTKPSDFAAGITDVAGGVIGTGAVKRKPSSKKQNEEAKPDKVAVHSSRNVSWAGVGKVYRGYNIVTKEQADKWLTRGHIRLATPEEVAQEFGL